MEEEPEAKYRKVMKEILLENKLSGKDVQRLSMASTLAGSKGVEDFAKAGASGTSSQNIYRDLLKAITKDTDYPEYYWADIPLFDPKLQRTVVVKMPFLLPHEIAQALHNNGKLKNAKTNKLTCPKGVWSHMREAGNLLEKPIEEMIAFGIHVDAVNDLNM